MLKKIVSTLVMLGFINVLNAGESHSYLSFVAGKLDFNKKVYGDIDGEERRFQSYTDVTLTGIEYTWLKEVGEGGFLLGVSPRILWNDGEFFDGGFTDINFLIGKSFNKFKLYGNIGYGLHSLSEYSISLGKTYGVTARYDITEKFSMALVYNLYDMEISTTEINNPTRKYKIDGVLIDLSLKF